LLPETYSLVSPVEDGGCYLPYSHQHTSDN
jgi:hypothetical protein